MVKVYEDCFWREKDSSPGFTFLRQAAESRGVVRQKAGSESRGFDLPDSEYAAAYIAHMREQDSNPNSQTKTKNSPEISGIRYRETRIDQSIPDGPPTRCDAHFDEDGFGLMVVLGVLYYAVASWQVLLRYVF